MKPADLVKRIWAMGLRPFPYFPPERVGIPVVSIGYDTAWMTLDLNVLPPGWTVETNGANPNRVRIYWLNAEWDREYGKEPSDASRC